MQNTPENSFVCCVPESFGRWQDFIKIVFYFHKVSLQLKVEYDL